MRSSLLNLAAITTPAVHSLERGQSETLPRTATLLAAALIATIAILITNYPLASPTHADGGASTRSQAATHASNDSGATIQTHAQRILHTLTAHDANNWVRYWQARYDCAAAARHAPTANLDRFLLILTVPICAHIDARLGVNPTAHSPRGENRTVGLLLNEPAAAATGYTLFTGYWNHDVFLLDPLGRVAHAWNMDTSVFHAKLLDNGNLLVSRPDRVVEFDPRGNIVWQYGPRKLHHDFLKMPNGNVLLLARSRKTNEQAIAAGANPQFVHESGIAYDYLLEVRPADASGGDVVWEWSVWDHLIQHFDPTKPNYGAIADHPELIDINFLLQTISERRPHEPRDWLHTNAIDYNPALDQIMLSPRHFSELWIIDRSTTTEEARGHSGGNSGMGGDLIYRWGNPRAYGHGTLADQRLFWQHQPQWIPPGLPGDGNILIFNNGLEFTGDERLYSSVDEIAPPVDGAAGTISQATPDGRIVWKYVVPLNRHFHLRQGERPSIKETLPTPYGDPAPWLNNSVYRAYWYPPDHPGLRALDITPGAYIEDIPDIYDRAYEIVAAAAAGDFGAPIARSDFDIYLDQNKRRIIYTKQPCAADDARAKFFLHITPSDMSDLPDYKQEHGFDNFDFNFDGSEVQASDDWCVAMQRLPGYPIQRVKTGQFTGRGRVWRADIDLNE